jgi:hypothetical protein
MKPLNKTHLYTLLAIAAVFLSASAFGQNDASASARTDARQVLVGDQVKMFIEVRIKPGQGRLEWATLPDTFNSLEIVEKGKIDTSKEGAFTVYKQRLLIAGYDSGSFKIPPFAFAVLPAQGAPYTLQTDSFQLLVQTVAVDTTQPFKPIKEIIAVKTGWKDYILLILGGIVFLLLLGFVIFYFIRNKKTPIPVFKLKAPPETASERALRLLSELDQQKLWQNNKVKEYYTVLTDVLRNYLEERFNTPALELTTDEILHNARMQRDLQPFYDQLAGILYTADLAKFAKAEPTAREHTELMETAKSFIQATKPVIKETTPKQL